MSDGENGDEAGETADETVVRRDRFAGGPARSFLSSLADDERIFAADLAVDRTLRETLTAARPAYGWLSEESSDNGARLQRERVWMVDPIDGTRAFLKQKPEWTVAAALVEAGRPVIGVIFNPVTDELFHAVKGTGAYCNGEPLRVSDPVALESARLLASGGLLRRRIWDRSWPEIETVWVNSVAYRLALVAAGRFDATLSLSAKHDWDLAAAALLVQEAGGRATAHTGEEFRYNGIPPLQRSVVAAGPSLHMQLLERTRSARI
jgi:myo-inositol-1(or 4)-monophosphatase